MQKPGASNNVAGIRRWNSLGRFVKRGEREFSFWLGKKCTTNEGTEHTKEGIARSKKVGDR